MSRRQIASEQAATFEPVPVNDQCGISLQYIAFGALAITPGFGLHQLVASIQYAISGASACRAPAAVRNLSGNGEIQRRPVYTGLAAGDDALNVHPCPVAVTVQLT